MGKIFNISSLRKALLCCIVLVFSVVKADKAFAQISEQALRVHWILILSEYVDWPGPEIEEYSIGIYGYNAPEYDTLVKMLSKCRIKGKPVSALHFKRVKEIVPTHILYVNSEYNDELSSISSKIGGDSTLVITYSVPEGKNRQYFMINLLLKGRGNQFEVNSRKAEAAGLTISDKVLAQGGTRVDLITLVDNKDKQLQEKENLLLLQEMELQKKEKDITSQVIANDIEQDQTLMQRYELESKEKEIVAQKRYADSLTRSANSLQEILIHNNVLLEKQEREIEEKQQQLNTSTKELENQQNRISEREGQIEEHEKRLNMQAGQIDTQKRIIFVAIIFAVIIFILVVLTAVANASRKRKNRQLAQLNDEVDRQKDHIQAQSQQLLQINKELEKLSIVASQTDNGVMIMDNLGNIEWVNRGFSNMYGFTGKDLRNEAKDSFTGFYASNKDILSIKEECLGSSKPKVFECEVCTKQGKNIWVQSTLTPILDENNEISRLVTIDTDITQIKEQEYAILQQGKTLALQRDELAQQNEFISEQNAHINTSLTYAKTIQETVMPLEVNITKYFKYFGIFIPLQIVSGDFYWFTRVPDDERIAFTAAVDCTGHGVPGAFMCMIATRLLSEIIVEHRVYETSEILEQLNVGIVAALKQDETDNNDSLEICICRFTRVSDGEYEMCFSGAKRPLYIYHDETHEFETLKGDRKTIGGIMAKRNSTKFTSEIKNLRRNDKIYMTTDGFVNQFDSENRKYGSDKFLSLLKTICMKELPEEKQILEDEYHAYKGEAEQNDDVTVFAVQLI